eukprot:353939-Chlamydomonas_euryale.AAC.15
MTTMPADLVASAAKASCRSMSMKAMPSASRWAPSPGTRHGMAPVSSVSGWGGLFRRRACRKLKRALAPSASSCRCCPQSLVAGKGMEGAGKAGLRCTPGLHRLLVSGAAAAAAGGGGSRGGGGGAVHACRRAQARRTPSPERNTHPPCRSLLVF